MKKPSVNRSKIVHPCQKKKTLRDLQTYISNTVDACTLTHLLIFFQDDTRDMNTHADTSTHTPAHPPLVIVELLLHQEQVGFELIPLENDVTHLLLGEARLVGILVVTCQLVR